MFDKKDKQDQSPRDTKGGSSWILPQHIIPGGIRPQHLVPNPVQQGDIFFTGGNANFNRVGIGTTGQVLQVVAGVPTWGSATNSGIATARPTSGRYLSDMYYATDTNVLSIWNGTGWKSSTFT
jgi:hypothetical protein